MEPKLRAVRGATTIDEDVPDQIRSRTQELMIALLERNEIANDDLVSIIFTSTEDVVSTFPATAARELGLTDVALLGACEVPVPGALGHCIRVLIHCYSLREKKEIENIYLHGAVSLRGDLGR